MFSLPNYKNFTPKLGRLNNHLARNNLVHELKCWMALRLNKSKVISTINNNNGPKMFYNIGPRCDGGAVLDFADSPQFVAGGYLQVRPALNQTNLPFLASFCLFSSFTHYNSNLKWWKPSTDVVIGIRIWGHMMACADGSSELWGPPNEKKCLKIKCPIFEAKVAQK